MKQYLAIDVGGTSTKYALVSEQGELAEKHKQPTARNSRAEFMAAMAALIHRYQGQIAGVGLALPGVVNQQQGIVKTCAALPFLETMPLAARLKDAAHLNIPVVIGNDGNAAALAEHWQGKLAGTINSAMIVLGTGVGAALFLNGTL
ncbi:MAG: ROK family protein, partial [Lacticaseibacillus rhamnosus]